MKRVLLTGASSGIGLATAKRLAAEGYELTLVARSGDKLKELVASLPGRHAYLVADLSKPEGIENIALHLSDHPYEVLINNAGAGLYGRFTVIPLPDQLAMMRLNNEAMVILSYAYLKNARRGDSLINVGSFLGSTSYSGASTYSGTKGFVVRFSESLWEEYRKDGIFVCAFNPGLTSSGFHKHAGGAETDFPGYALQSANEVARALVKTIRRKDKPYVLSGMKYVCLLFFFRFLPRKTIVKIMGRFRR